eukprot:XP_011427733.1 PREDICTED: uncharacterized protein LOC105328518 isoform X1 [Crassostrea gigas]
MSVFFLSVKRPRCACLFQNQSGNSQPLLNVGIIAYPTNSLDNNNTLRTLTHSPIALLQYRHSKKKHGILSWTQTEKNTYVHGGVDLSENKYLVLPSTGYYDVQTRVQMDTYTVDMQPSKEVLIRLAVNVMAIDGHVKTLMEEKFILGPKQMFGKQLGPVTFKLPSGCAVYVVMNGREYINPSKHNTFSIRKWSD